MIFVPYPYLLLVEVKKWIAVIFKYVRDITYFEYILCSIQHRY